jgi:hypothetical protein
VAAADPAETRSRRHDAGQEATDMHLTDSWLVTAVRAALLSLLLLTAGTVGLARADARTSGSERTDVRRILAPIGAFDRAVETKRPELEQLGAAWSAGVAPCLEAGYAELGRQADAGTLTASDASTYGWILFSVALWDAAVELAEPLDGELAKAKRAYRRMTLGDRVLRAGARGKAREITALRGLPDIDTCRFAAEWSATGFSILDLPDVAPGLAVTDDVGGAAATRGVKRATRRLRRLGVSKVRAETFQFFPLVTVAEPALGDGPFPPG